MDHGGRHGMGDDEICLCTLSVYRVDDDATHIYAHLLLQASILSKNEHLM